MTTDKMSYKLRNNEWIKISGKYKYFDSALKTNNLKKIICKNVIMNGSCVYGTKCLYAHTLDDQNVDKIRKLAYDIIRKKKSCKDINILTSRQLYETFKLLSNVCEQCENNKCTGGYNCKHGACKSEYAICLSDMNKGSCTKTCNKIHLTDYGLVPYCVQIAAHKNEKKLTSNISTVDNLSINFNHPINPNSEIVRQTHTVMPFNEMSLRTKSIFKIDIDKIEINVS